MIQTLPHMARWIFGPRERVVYRLSIPAAEAIARVRAASWEVEWLPHRVSKFDDGVHVEQYRDRTGLWVLSNPQDLGLKNARHYAIELVLRPRVGSGNDLEARFEPSVGPVAVSVWLAAVMIFAAVVLRRLVSRGVSEPWKFAGAVGVVAALLVVIPVWSAFDDWRRATGADRQRLLAVLERALAGSIIEVTLYGASAGPGFPIQINQNQAGDNK